MGLITGLLPYTLSASHFIVLTHLGIVLFLCTDYKCYFYKKKKNQDILSVFVNKKTHNLQEHQVKKV